MTGNVSGGKLYIVSTPIGNLEDITLRAIRVLKEADLIAAEDTRHTRILLNHYQITTRLTSYHAFNEHQKVADLLEKVTVGMKVAIVSDAGTPGIADPGFLIVREAIKAGIEPEIIPGVSSLTFAAVASGLPIDKFIFYGFLPVKSGRRNEAVKQISVENKSCIIFESPHRMEKLLKEISAVIGTDTQVAVIREATKMFEEVIRGKVSEVIEKTSGRKWKGECILAVSSRLAAPDDSIVIPKV
jgi:16S rRNA (cytidine1402-2'-O)-methyltransferase